MDPINTKIAIWNTFLQDFKPLKCMTYLNAVHAKIGNITKGAMHPIISYSNA
jgi:hypothetical protein